VLTREILEKIPDKKNRPSWSPSLYSYDVLLWCCLEQKVYNMLPKRFGDLQSNMKREVQKIQKTNFEFFFRVFKNFDFLFIFLGGLMD
jgi:hypothetical protein